MRKQNGKDKKRKKGISRRYFIKTSASAGTVTVARLAALGPAEGRGAGAEAPGGGQTQAQAEKPARAGVNRKAILFAIGDTLIPSAPGDPGYRDLEWYGIAEAVERWMDEMSDDDLALFNSSSAGPLKKEFTKLSEQERADYFNMILKEGSFKDEALQGKLKAVYDATREAVFTVYYQNFPQNSWPRDSNGVPLLRPGDTRQITNPSTQEVFTGWDLAGYAGPLTWEEEERRRNFFKKIRWQE
ncbi:MAG TPA: hypothetical protein VNO14_15950 [Blastocatellia bacterium]|nr:hypothetical protein [Blastocatellia bacterium]